jgi:hypothetical protein
MPMKSPSASVALNHWEAAFRAWMLKGETEEWGFTCEGFMPEPKVDCHPIENRCRMHAWTRLKACGSIRVQSDEALTNSGNLENLL